MAKGPSSSKSSGKPSAAASAAAKCTCDHPYTCSCGHRPPRPSTGHKWNAETQTWGGKGHKQKGASGQTASKDAGSRTTAIGQTTLATWQKLPSTILQQVLQKSKQYNNRLNYKAMKKGTVEPGQGLFQFRLILTDVKGDSKKDLIITPPNAVANEEQAKEEVCLLALLHLTPNLPHERTLPEPYRSTWLAAIAQAKQQMQQQATKAAAAAITATATTSTTTTNDKNKTVVQTATNTSSSSTCAATNTDTSTARAQASTNLWQGAKITSKSQSQQSQLEARRRRNDRARRHEAIRMANRLPRVAMSAPMRKLLEQLLRTPQGGKDSTLVFPDNKNNQFLLDVDDDDNDGKDLPPPTSDVQAYVEQRLTKEGFSPLQARQAFENSKLSTLDEEDDDDDESLWDSAVYEPCLQWLLLHIDEQDLPDGFGPNAAVAGSSLDVIVAGGGGGGGGGIWTSKPITTNTKPEITIATATDASTQKLTSEQEAFRQSLRLSRDEVMRVFETADAQNSSPRAAFWYLVKTQLAAVNHGKERDAVKEEKEEEDFPKNLLSRQECRAELSQEIETLQAIFDTACRIEENNSNGNLTTTVVLEMEEHQVELHVEVERERYPNQPPCRVLVVFMSSPSPPPPNNNHLKGTALHMEIAEFLQTSFIQGAPAVFQIHSHVQELLSGDMSELPPVLLAQTTSTANSCQQLTSTAVDSFQIPSPPPLPLSVNVIAAKSNNTSNTGRITATPTIVRQQPQQRPREKAPFWSKPSSQTPPATAYPRISASLQKARASLPAASVKAEFSILLQQASQSNGGGGVVLLTGETGCGKSTQIPQFILEESPNDAKIVVCQPRRVAATGVASRVAEERGESQPGQESVGYIVRGDSAICAKSRLVFCTTGVLLRQMQTENAFDALTHIVLDEVHERSLEMDILLALLKERLSQHAHLSVVLMSATLDADKFVSYWGSNTPKIHIPGRTFPVKDLFLEDVLALTNYIPPKRKGKKPNADKSSTGDIIDNENEDGTPISKDATGSEQDFPQVNNGIPIKELVARVDETMMDYKLIACLVKHILANKEPGDDGSILIFLPGAPEINLALEMVAKSFSATSTPSSNQLVLLPLHGGLQPKEQNFVFRPVGPGRHKIIFSTNIAETSVTIPDCTAVIDCGREKQSSYDPSNRMPLLIETFCSKASLKQRRGRAGRVRSGTCFKLLSQSTFKSLRQDTEPEILRSALDQTLLSLLFLRIDCSASGSFMRSLLDPPSAEALRSALESLMALGAVDESTNALTPLGMHLAGIPAPPVVGKILVLGSILGCRDAALAMGAGMSVGRTPLLRIDAGPRRGGTDKENPAEEMKRKNALEARKKILEEVGKSDHAFLARLFLGWEDVKGTANKKAYCDNFGLSFSGMQDMLQLKQQFSSALASMGYVNTQESNKHGSFWRIIRAIAVAGMAPGQLAKIVRPAITYQETAEGAKEKEGKAQALKFFVRKSRDNTEPSLAAEERVFIHPSSELFSVGNYGCPWLVYNSLVRTSKPFLRDVTECNEYSLLLFGGDLEIQAAKGVITVDKWCQLSASPKIGALVGGLRKRLDELLAKKVSDPLLDIAATTEMKIISRLIRKDGS